MMEKGLDRATQNSNRIVFITGLVWLTKVMIYKEFGSDNMMKQTLD